MVAWKCKYCKQTAELCKQFQDIWVSFVLPVMRWKSLRKESLGCESLNNACMVTISSLRLFSIDWIFFDAEATFSAMPMRPFWKTDLTQSVGKFDNGHVWKSVLAMISNSSLRDARSKPLILKQSCITNWPSLHTEQQLNKEINSYQKVNTQLTKR